MDSSVPLIIRIKSLMEAPQSEHTDPIRPDPNGFSVRLRAERL